MAHFTHCKEPLGPETLEAWAARGWVLARYWTTWDRRYNRHCYAFVYAGR
jgi:hypothetical protein